MAARERLQILLSENFKEMENPNFYELYLSLRLSE